jgi:hypothetical protein
MRAATSNNTVHFHVRAPPLFQTHQFIPAMQFIERQTNNLKELVDTARQAQATPDQLKTTHQKQHETVVLKAVRCPRCGSAVYPLFPVPVLCGDCCRELLARDRSEAPDCKWWGELVRQLNQPRDPSSS